jgi:hypothetical protein
MKRTVIACTVLPVLGALSIPVAAEPAETGPVAVATAPAAARKSARTDARHLRERRDALARQIAEIDANIANLGPRNAAALRFRAVSLAAYRHVLAELASTESDIGDAPAHETAAARTR